MKIRQLDWREDTAGFTSAITCSGILQISTVPLYETSVLNTTIFIVEIYEYPGAQRVIGSYLTMELAKEGAQTWWKNQLSFWMEEEEG